MFYRLGLLMYRRRWLVIACWLALAAASAPFVLNVAQALKVGTFSSQEVEAAQARKLLIDSFGSPGAALVIIFSSDTLTADDPRFIADVQAALADVKTTPGVSKVVEHTVNFRQVSPDGHTALEQVFLDVAAKDGPATLRRVQARLHPTALHAIVAGPLAFYNDIVQVTAEDLRRAEMVAFPIAVVVLALVFGSLVAAGVPVVIGGVSVALSLVAIRAVGQVTDMSVFVLNTATMLGLGLGVDYALFMTYRFREEMALRQLNEGWRKGRATAPVEDAVATTVATAGRAVFYSGITVGIGLLGLIPFDFTLLRSVGIGGTLVVLITVTAGLTLLPALFAALGPRIDRLAIPLPSRGIGRTWEALAYRVMRRPWAFVVPVLVLLAVLGAPFASIKLSSPDATVLPSRVPSRQGFDVLRRSFGADAFDPVLVVVRLPEDALSPAGLATLYDFTHRIALDPRVARVQSVTTLDHRYSLGQYRLIYRDPQRISDPYARGTAAESVRGNLAAIQVFSKAPPLSEDTKDVVRMIRLLRAQYPQLQVLVDGGAAEVMDGVSRMYGEFPRTLLFIVVTTYVILLVLFRSALLPLKAIIMNTLSLCASFGALVWVFQEGHLSGLLRFEPLGFIESSLPIIMFCAIFGLSMDYEVFLLTRVKEVWDRTHDNARSVALGLESSGRIITSAALIVIAVSVAFVSADVVLIKALGVGVAIAVAVDATIVRALLVPATMRLLGRWNWWLPAFGVRAFERWNLRVFSHAPRSHTVEEGGE